MIELIEPRTNYSLEQIDNAIHYYLQTGLTLHRVKQIFNVYNSKFDKRWKEYKIDNRMRMIGSNLVFIDTPYKTGLLI